MALFKIIFASQILVKLNVQLFNLLAAPILLHYDETCGDYANPILHLVSDNQTVLVSTVDENSRQLSMHVSKSAVLIGRSAENVFLSLRGYSQWNGRGQVIVIAEKYSIVREWLSAAWQHTRAINVVVAVMADPVRYYTWFPYSQPHCANESMAEIKEVRMPTIFPTRTPKTFEGCQLKTVSSILKPYNFGGSRGLETRLLHSFAAKFNLTLTNIDLPFSTPVFIQLLGDKPAFGLKMVWENQVDVVFTYQIMREDVAVFADYVFPHSLDTFRFYVPAPSLAHRSAAIFRAFPPKMWFVFFLCFIAMQTFSLYLHIKSKATVMDSITRVFLISLNLSTTWLRSRAFYTFTMVAYIYSLHITAAYESSLIKFLSRLPRERAITTMKDLIEDDSRVIFGAPSLQKILLANDPEMMVLINSNRSVFLPLSMLKFALEPKKTVFGPTTPFDFELATNEDGDFTDEYFYPRVLILKDTFLDSFLTFFISPGHPLQPFLNHFMYISTETGLNDHYRHIDETIRKSNPSISQKRPFGLENVEGAFLLYGFLVIISTLTFFFELLHWYGARSKFFLKAKSIIRLKN